MEDLISHDYSTLDTIKVEWGGILEPFFEVPVEQ